MLRLSIEMGKKTTSKKLINNRNKRPPNDLMKLFSQEMAKHCDAESLNTHVLVPFITALEKVAYERNYILNIYGAKSNLVFTNEEDAEKIFELVEKHLDERN